MKIAGMNVNKSAVTEIGKFAILWNHFEHFYCNNHCDSSRIKEIANFIKISEDKMNLLREALKNRMDIFEEDTTNYVHQGLHPEGARQSSIENKQYMEQFINNDSDQMNNTIGCLLIIQRIRNNMMHGLKDISDLSGQLELFQAVNGVLEDISEC